jgi:hypothetical protein
MTDAETIDVIAQDPEQVTLSTGKYQVKPLTVRRLSKLAAMLKDVQGDPKNFQDVSSPDFQKNMADMLVAAGDNMPRALGLFTGDEELAKLEDISLLDLSAIVLVAARVNKASFLLANFRKATEVFNGKADQK